MTTLPTTTPAESIQIAPEQLEVANQYLQTPNIDQVADILDVPKALVTQILATREVKAYIDSVFFNTGFNNRFQLRDLMDTLIKKKLQEMDEADAGSNKDITELITLSHKITMEQLDKELKIEQLRQAAAPKVQTNIQINEGVGALGGTKYGALIQSLLTQAEKSNEEVIDV